MDTDGFNKCFCSSNIACKFCSIESNNYNLCVSCNNDKDYYHILNDENNIQTFFNCYNNNTILEGYYLNINAKYYEKCYSTCKKCYGVGDINNNKCTECISTHEFKEDFENDNNCYEKCSKYYYFDLSKNFYCVNECPSDFNKLIEPKNKCINNCSNDQDYKYEYENKCYQSCSPKYYNYEKTLCIDDIPDGFYCNDDNQKTIDKCHDNCETCIEGPTEDNNNCLTCKENKCFDLGNCVDKCDNGYFLDTGNITKCKCTSNIACHYCSNESKKHNLCESCNNDEGYYSKSDEEITNNIFINCYKDPEGYFLEGNNKEYRPCYSTCKKCLGNGNEENNNCAQCFFGYEFKSDFENDKNCYKKCDYYYYFNSEKQYFCTEIDSCPLNYSKLIISKNKCIDNCINDEKYKYDYKDKCYEKCPTNTIPSENNTYICEDIKVEEHKEEECKITKQNLNDYKKDVTINDINPLTKDYANNFFSRNDYVYTYENDFISIYIYKNISCLEATTGSAPQIDFGECYQKLKNNYSFTEDLIISIITINNNENTKPITTYAFSNPKTGEVLNSSKVCENETIIIQEDVKALIENIDDTKEEYILFCTKQGINVFNISNEFYNDLCFHFESPNGRDVPLKDRIAMFYPNITLCDKGCENRGIDFENLKAKCECTFNDLMGNQLFTDNLYGQSIEEIMDLLSSLNIAVVQCIKDIFNKKYFIKCDGAFIFLGLFLFEIICIIKFISEGLYKIRKFLLNLTQAYFDFISKNKNKLKRKKKRQNLLLINFPPKNKAKSKDSLKKDSFSCLQNPNISSNRNLQKKNSFRNKQNINSNLEERTNKKLNSEKPKKGISYKNQEILKTSKESNQEKDEKINIKEYLSISFDENDFDDVIDMDKRTFWQYFCEKFQENQIFINSFFIIEPLRPRSLKLLVLILTIQLYFTINALFYTEEYLSEIFYINKKDSFFAFVPRRFNHFIYTSVVSKIITYLIEFFFIEERKIKKIFIRNKEGELKLKYDISNVTKDIEKRFYGLIISSVIVTIISFIYISCFNIVYPNTKIEWIKSSIFILIIMQIINFIFTFTETSIRYFAIKFNSEKIFKLGLILA